MKKALISLFVLSTLAACGGGGGGGSSTPAGSNEPTSNTNPSGQGAGSTGTPSQDTTGSAPAQIRARFDACPMAAASNSAGSARCLAGTYTGEDIFTGEACTIRIAADGSTEATRGSLSFTGTPTTTYHTYSKVSYLPIAGTSPIGYVLLWGTTLRVSEEATTTVFFSFNANYDEKLKIEIGNISCGIRL